MNNTEELKPCPFCGSTQVEAFVQDCHRCDAQSARIKIAMTSRAWNKRISR
jgi:hypothetical protein